MRARLVPVTTLPLISSEPWVDQKRKPFVTREGAYIPVKSGYDATHILQERKRNGRGFQKLGDVIIFHGDRPEQQEIDEVMTLEQPRGILWISGHDGIMRRPRIVVLHGQAGEVLHRESGICYHLDVEQIMFSQGNREEKSRIASLIRPGEQVCDMFSGIGYFTLGMARAGAMVHAMEINPVSFRYLIKNIHANNLTGQVKADEGDCRDLLTGTYDRIHMGHFDAVSFIPRALEHSRPGTILHIHMINDQTGEIHTSLADAGYTGEISVYRVKKYGPRQMHLTADVIVS